MCVEAAVVAMPSEEWGETPVAFVVLKPGAAVDAAALKAWTNSRVGKFQRLNDVVLVDTLPRSAIGKVLKRELRDELRLAQASTGDLKHDSRSCIGGSGWLVCDTCSVGSKAQ